MFFKNTSIIYIILTYFVSSGKIILLFLITNMKSGENMNKKFIRDFLFFQVPENNKKEFNSYINRINIVRGKFVAAAFIFIESFLILFFIIIKKQQFFKAPDLYYGYIYLLILIAMIIYLVIFNKLGKDIPKNETSIICAGITFAIYILLCHAGLSLLDQMSTGQIVVYVVAIISIAVCPIYEPSALLFIYLCAQIPFILLMPHFQKSPNLLYMNYINSSSFLIISWVISLVRYKYQVDIFTNKKIIEEKNSELERLNIELKDANEKLKKLSRTDSLTGIFNRYMFDRTIKIEWNTCQRHFIPLSLLIIDIDFFKAYNDNYGHQAGDYCLQRIAGVIKSCVKRSADTVARYGGEEFAVILPYMEKEDAYKMAEKIRRNVENINIKHGYSSTSGHVTISIGVNTVIPSEKLSIKDFIKAADIALYKAKDKKRNNTVVA